MTGEFSLELVLDAARAEAGISDFASEDFLKPLGRYLQGLDDSADHFSAEGKAIAQRELVSQLVTRLRTDEYVRENPEVNQEKIVSPVFITGLYRSGTSKLQNLLCADPSWMYLRSWQVNSPAPLAAARPGEEDPRITARRITLLQMKDRASRAFQAHPLDVDDPTEEFPLLTQSFLLQDAKQFDPSFREWVEAQDMTPMYHHLQQALRVLQHQFRPAGVTEPRYLLKAPAHLGNVESLLNVFPDAKVIFAHRDPFPAVHSFTMVRESLRGIYGAAEDPERLGGEILETVATALDNSLLARRKFPSGRFFDFAFEDTVQRPMERMQELYDYLEAPLSDDAVEFMSRADEQRDQHRSRAESRDPALYGLSPELVHERTRRYLEWAREYVGGLA